MAKNKIKIISAEGDTNLRAINKEDIELLREWKNKNRKYFFHNKIISMKQQLGWFQSYQEAANDYIFLIEYNGLKIGCVGFRLINNVIDIYNVILGNKEFGGRGIMGSALRLMCSYIMDNYDMEITLRVLLDNDMARQWYMKNGFEETGRKEDHISMRLNINKFRYLKYNLEVD